jgi:hypothetical protein
MARDWIDQGLRGELEREEQRRLAHERRMRQAAVIEEKGPRLMSQLVAEIAAVVDEYRAKTRVAGDAVTFEALPHQGFCVEKTGRVRTALECRPAYDAQCVYSNMSSNEGDDIETRELVFSLRFTVNESDDVELCHEDRTFHSVGEAVEFLLKPVLFPSSNLQLGR